MTAFRLLRFPPVDADHFVRHSVQGAAGRLEAIVGFSASYSWAWVPARRAGDRLEEALRTNSLQMNGAEGAVRCKR